MDQPFVSDIVVFNNEVEVPNYSYHFARLPPNTYTVAFSCSAVANNSVEYDEITIAAPAEQMHKVVIGEAEAAIQNFEETL